MFVEWMTAVYSISVIGKINAPPKPRCLHHNPQDLWLCCFTWQRDVAAVMKTLEIGRLIWTSWLSPLRVRVRGGDGQQGRSHAGPRAKEFEQTLAAGRGKETGSPLQLPEKHNPTDPFISTHWNPCGLLTSELWDNKCVLFQARSSW